MAVAVYKPSALVLPSGNPITQFDQPPSFNPTFNHLSIIPPGATGPGFTGTNFSAPAVNASTTQVKDVLDFCTVDAIARSLAGGNTDLEFTKINNLGTRDAYTALSHMRLRATTGLLYWEGLSARGTDPATIDLVAMLLSSDGVTSPVAKSSGVALSAAPTVQHVYGLGGVKIDGSFFCVDAADWKNNATVPDPKTCSGATYPTFAYVQDWAPVVTIDSEDADSILSYLPDGQSISSFDLFLRKRKQGGGNEANASAVHIKLSSSAGSVKPGVSSNQLEFHLHSFTVSTASAIS